MNRRILHPSAFTPLAAMLLSVFWTAAASDASLQPDQVLKHSQDPLASWAREVQKNPQDHGYLDLALRLGPEIFPDLTEEKTKQIRQRFSQLGAELKTKLAKVEQADQTVQTINLFLFGNLGLRRADADGTENEKPDYFFPHRVLDNKKGVCLGLSLIYLDLCDRAGVPVYPIHAPQHIYLRYDDGQARINIEATDEGKAFDENTRYDNIPKGHLTDGYFRPISKAAVLGDLLNVTAWCSAIGTAPKPVPNDRRILIAQLGVALSPKNYNNWDTLAEALRSAKRHREALEILNKVVTMQPPEVGDYNRAYWKKRIKRFQNSAKEASEGEKE